LDNDSPAPGDAVADGAVGDDDLPTLSWNDTPANLTPVPGMQASVPPQVQPNLVDNGGLFSESTTPSLFESSTPVSEELDPRLDIDRLLNTASLPQDDRARTNEIPVASVSSSAVQSSRLHGIDLSSPEPELPGVEQKQPLWTGPPLTTFCSRLTPELEPYVKRLDFQDAAIRKTALADLASFGEDAKPAIPAITVLLDDTPLVAAHAAWSIWEIERDHRTATYVLTQLLEEGDVESKQFTAYALGAIGPHAHVAAPALRAARERSSGISRLHIAEALTRIDAFDEGSVDVLTNAMLDREAEHRWIAAIALGQVSTRHAERVVPVLIDSLRDREPKVRSAAALSLGNFGIHAQNAVPELKQRAANDSNEVRTAAKTALSCIPH